MGLNKRRNKKRNQNTRVSKQIFNKGPIKLVPTNTILALQNVISAPLNSFWTLKRDSNTLKRDSNTLKRDSSTLKRDSTTQKCDSTTQKRDSTTQKRDSTTQKHDSSTLKHDSNTLKHDSNTLKHDSSTLKRDSSTQTKFQYSQTQNIGCYKIGEATNSRGATPDISQNASSYQGLTTLTTLTT